MGQADSPFIGGLVSEEIRRIVADAIRSGDYLWTIDHAAAVLKTYPNCGLNESEIADELVMAAASAGVPVKIGRGDGPAKVKSRVSRGKAHSEKVAER